MKGNKNKNSFIKFLNNFNLETNLNQRLKFHIKDLILNLI